MEYAVTSPDETTRYGKAELRMDRRALNLTKEEVISGAQVELYLLFRQTPLCIFNNNHNLKDDLTQLAREAVEKGLRQYWDDETVGSLAITCNAYESVANADFTEIAESVGYRVIDGERYNWKSKRNLSADRPTITYARLDTLFANAGNNVMAYLDEAVKWNTELAVERRIKA